MSRFRYGALSVVTTSLRRVVRQGARVVSGEIVVDPNGGPILVVASRDPHVMLRRGFHAALVGLATLPPRRRRKLLSRLLQKAERFDAGPSEARSRSAPS